MRTSERWREAIQRACREPDPQRSNYLITHLHYALSEALADCLGREGGPNFHTWAVWGSRKAGVTIRQEDLDDAVHDAKITAGIVGGVTGACSGVVLGRRLRLGSDPLAATIGCCLGVAAGCWAGIRLAMWSRQQAASLVLAGNQTVLQDIGEQSARFLELLEAGAAEDQRRAFFAGLRPGSSETQGQDRLAKAFSCYLKAFDSSSIAEKREAMIAGNSEIVFHEHIRLDPYIRGAMPWIVRRCTTQRLMSYEVGHKTFAVSRDVPGVGARTAAQDWTNIHERMRYVFALFRRFHADPEVFAHPDSGR